MEQFKGTVGYIGEKKWGTKTFFSFTIKGTDGFFRTGVVRPSFKQGGYIQFEADAQKNVDMNSIVSIGERAPDEVVKEQSAKIGGMAPGTKPIDFRAEADKARQKSIHYQSAHKDAIEVAKYAVEKGLIRLPVSAPKGYDAFLALIDDLTQQFFTKFESEHTVNSSPEATDAAEGGESGDE